MSKSLYDAREAKIRGRDQADYRAFLDRLPELLKTHRGQFVAIHDGCVVDSDESDLALAWRVYHDVHVPAFVGFVSDAPPIITDLELVRNAITHLALPAQSQIDLFPTADTAATELIRRYEVAHNINNISRSDSLLPLIRQVLDELLEFVAGGFCSQCEPTAKPWTDAFLRESVFWAEIREKAKDALDVMEMQIEVME